MKSSNKFFLELKKVVKQTKFVGYNQTEVEAELEYYYLLCQKQLELLAANEDLQKQVIDILANLRR